MRSRNLIFVVAGCAASAHAFVPKSGFFSSRVSAAIRPSKHEFVSHPIAFATSLRSSDSATESTVADVRADEEVAAVQEGRLLKLQHALEQFESPGAKDLLSELSQMRAQSVDPATREAFVDDLLTQGPDRPSRAMWTRLGVLARFSKRARWASLQRTLDMTTPPPSESEEEDALESSDPLNQQRRRRRALIALLRSLAAPDGETATSRRGPQPAIRSLENKARREKRASTGGFFLSRWLGRMSASGSPDELTKRRPENLETPNYSVLARRGSMYEIRRYEPYSICSVSMTKPRPANSTSTTDATVSDPQLSGARSFGALAGYLFGKNQQETSMAMTTPVLTRDSRRAGSSSGDKLMSFVLPSEFWQENGLDQAPRPLYGSGVVLERMESDDRAVAMFGGYASKKEVLKRKQQLIQDLARDKEWKVVIDDAESGGEEPVVLLAQYNDPFTPPWKRLNEVAVSVQRRE